VTLLSFAVESDEVIGVKVDQQGRNIQTASHCSAEALFVPPSHG